MKERRTRHWANVAALGCASMVPLLLVTREGGAAGETARAVRIDYDAPASCPDEASFETQLRSRSSKIGVSTDPAISVRVRISARRAGARVDGEVTIVDAAGHEARRHVEGGCGDVTAALALITALALDPAASTAPVPTAAPSSTASAPPPNAAATTSPSAPPAPSAPATPPPSAADERGTPGASPHPWTWSIGAGAALTGGVTPQPLFTVPVFVNVARRAPELFAPAVRIRFERAESGTITSLAGGADFTWTAGSADLCPVAWSPWRLRFWPCARIEAGLLQATGTGIAPVRSETRPWLTLGGALRGRLTLYGALFAEIEGTAFAPFVRDRFFVEPDTTIQRAPPVAAAGAAGIGASFW